MDVKADPKTLQNLVVGDKVFRSATNYAFSNDDVKQMLKMFNKTEEQLISSLQQLKEMLTKNKMVYRMDDAYLLRFLRCRKFNCKEAYDMISSLYSVRKKYPDTFCSVPSHLEAFLNVTPLTFLPYRDEEGSLVILERFGRWNPQEFSAHKGLQLIQIFLDILSMNPACQVNKILILIDVNDTTMSHYSPLLSISFLMLSLRVVQNINPIRIKRFILFNCNKVAAVAVATFKLFMKKKLVDRIVILGSDLTELHEYVDPDILPKEYGGLVENDIALSQDHIMNNLPYLNYEYSFCK